MKKNLITILILVLPFFISAQQSPKSIFRDHVLLEVFAGTCCANLPGVEMAIGEIIENGDPVVILRHDYCNTTNGLYENAHAVGRYNYYQSFADPVAYFNGTVESYGGGYNSVYPDYSCCIQIELNELTDFDLHFSLENIKGNDFVAHVTAENLNPAVPVENRTLQLALTAMEVRNTWSNQDINIFHCIQVDMFPDHNGTPVDFSTGALQVFDVAFTIDSCYYDNLYRLVGFLQHDLTRDIVQDFYVDLPLPLYQNNAELLNVENISPGLCNEMMAPEVMIQNKGSENIHSLCIHFESSDNANYTYNWSGNIQSYQKEIIIIPENYIGIPADNKIRVFTTLPNGFPDQNPLNDTIVKEINTVDSTEMCLKVVFKTDDKPWESSWELLDQEGLVVASRDSFTEPYLLHIDTVYIASPGCHKLILHDSGGDGIETYFAIESWKNGGWRSMFYTKDFYFTSTCQINITKAAPLAAFEAENIHTCEGDNVQFFNTTNGTTDSIEWHFEGGIPETSNLLNPEVVYPNAGSFDVSLKIWSDFYCDTLIKENYISVFPYPEVQFSEIPDQCVNWPPLQLTQGWPEGGVYSGEFVENGYFYPQLAGVGDHGIKYVYTNAGGCADSALQNVRVDACVGIADAQDQPHLSIYPNPVGKAAYLNMTLAEEGIARIELIDLQNRCIPLYDGWCRAEQPVGIDLKDLKLNPGIYVLRVNTGATVFYQKVIIK